MKATMSEMKNTLVGMNCRLNIAPQKIVALHGIVSFWNSLRFGFWWWVLSDVMGVKWGHESGVLKMGLVTLKEVEKEKITLSPRGEETVRRWQWASLEEGSRPKPKHRLNLQNCEK